MGKKKKKQKYSYITRDTTTYIESPGGLSEIKIPILIGVAIVFIYLIFTT